MITRASGVDPVHKGKTVFFTCFAMLVGLMALVFAGLGIAAITSGWLLPNARPRIARPRQYGWGVLLMALGSCLTGGVIELFTDPIPGLGPASGLLPVFLGARVIRSSRHPEAAVLPDLGKL